MTFGGPLPPEIYVLFCRHRLSFNGTLFITGVFALSAGASPNSITLCSLAAVWSIGVGGNLPVDSAIFLGMSAVIKCQRGFPSYGYIPRIHTSLTPVPADCLVNLVGGGTTPW